MATVTSPIKENYTFTVFLLILFSFFSLVTSQFLYASNQPSSTDRINTNTAFNLESLITDNHSEEYDGEFTLVYTGGSYSNVADTINSTVVKCQGIGLCLKGDVVKVVNGKSFYVSINNKIYKVDLALIGVPATNPQLMMASATFTRNTCLGANVLIDQDDGQRNSDSIIGTVYCSPVKSLNSMLLDTGYVQLDRSQCVTSEFAKTDWARHRGC